MSDHKSTPMLTLEEFSRRIMRPAAERIVEDRLREIGITDEAEIKTLVEWLLASPMEAVAVLFPQPMDVADVLGIKIEA